MSAPSTLVLASIQPQEHLHPEMRARPGKPDNGAGMSCHVETCVAECYDGKIFTGNDFGAVANPSPSPPTPLPSTGEGSSQRSEPKWQEPPGKPPNYSTSGRPVTHRPAGGCWNIAASGLRLGAHQMLRRQFPHVGRWEETDDVLQRAMLRLYQSLEAVTLQSGQHFHNLAATQIRRELIELARHYYGPQGQGTKHETDHASDGAEGRRPPKHDPADWSAEPSSLAEWAELHRRVEQLPPAEREVVELRWYQGLTPAGATEVLGVTDRTVRRRLVAAKTKFARLFVESGPGRERTLTALFPVQQLAKPCRLFLGQAGQPLFKRQSAQPLFRRHFRRTRCSTGAHSIILARISSSNGSRFSDWACCMAKSFSERN